MSVHAKPSFELPVAVHRRHRPLFATPCWAVLLHRNQWNLGRAMVVLRTRRLQNPLDLDADEREELWSEALPRIAYAINSAFAPDRLNYFHLANRLEHVHWHVVPRYEANPVREFGGHVFEDKRQGRTPRSKKSGQVKRKLLKQIAAEIESHLPPD